MTDRATLLALASRCEAASASEAPALIREAVLLCGKEEALAFIAVGALLDAALTLVPEGFLWTCAAHYDFDEPVDGDSYYADCCSKKFNAAVYEAGGAKPDLALCAAALRAHAAALLPSLTQAKDAT